MRPFSTLYQKKCVGVITQGNKQKVSSSSEERRCKNPGHEKTRRDNYLARDIIAGMQ